MDPWMKMLLFGAGILVSILLLGWVGLRIQPRPFAAYPQPAGVLETIPVPGDLPAPVERFYRALYGDEIPVVETAVLTGRGQMRPFGPFYIPARFRFTHIAGQGYRHYIEATLFGIPVFKVNERYLEGKSLFELPFGVVDDAPKQNQGANLGLWAESLWLPSIFLTDPRVRWEAVDENTALLRVPFEEAQETYVVRFDPATGLVSYFESMRYQGPESPAKILWLNESQGWSELNGVQMMTTAAAIWLNEYTPWANFNLEEVVYNADVEAYIWQKGP
jgi:hypothetical protein